MPPTREQATSALDQALEDHVGVLFGVLCNGGGDAAAVVRFTAGLKIAGTAYRARAVIDDLFSAKGRNYAS